MELRWHVAHTRPRCEKKVAEFCAREALEHSLPLHRSVKHYRGKCAVFLKPLFPGYVFVRASAVRVARVIRHQHVASLLDVPDQVEFVQQLGDILAALASGLEIRLAPQVEAGARVTIKAGPLRGVEGWVEQRQGRCEVLLRLDFIGQAAAVRVDAGAVELT